MKLSEFFEKEMAALGDEFIVEAMECNKETVGLTAYYVEERPNVFKNIMTAAACILLAVAMTVSFVLMRRSITPGGQPTTGTETETTEPDTTDRETESETEPETETTANEETEMPVEELPVPEDGEQLVFLCVEKRSVVAGGSGYDHYFSYDEHGKLLSIRAVGEYPLTIQFEYDSDGALKEIIHEQTTKETRYKYDKGKIMSKEYDGVVSEKYEYDELGNCIRLIYAPKEDGSYNTCREYEYDENRRLIQQTVYDKDGFSYREKYFYNDQGLPARLEDCSEDDEIYGYEEYKYDENGKIIRNTRYKSAEDFIDGKLTKFFYVDLDRVLEYNDKGQLVSYQEYNKGDPGTRVEYEYGEHGYIIYQHVYQEDLDRGGDTTFNLTFDEFDRIIKCEAKSVYYNHDTDGYQETYYITYDEYGNISEERRGTNWGYECVYEAVCLTEEEIETINAMKQFADKVFCYETPYSFGVYNSMMNRLYTGEDNIEGLIKYFGDPTKR